MTRASGISGLLASLQSSGRVRTPLARRKTSHDSFVSMSCVSRMLTASSGNSRGKCHRDYSSRTSASNSQQGSFVQMIVRADLPIDPQRSQRQSRP